MSTRYLTNLALIVIGAFLVVVTQGFGSSAVRWLSFASAIGIALIGAGMTAVLPDRIQRSVGAVAGGLGVWTIVASLVFAPATVVWLAFSSACAVVAAGLTGLTAHELKTERVVHSLAIESSDEHVRHARRSDPLVA